jgi:hypothetical protein
MNAKQRYRKRLKLQAALARMIRVLANNGMNGIPADRTTALLAWQAIALLVPFVKAAGMNPSVVPEKDLSRYVFLLEARRKQTRARYRRRWKAWLGGFLLPTASEGLPT